MASTKEIDPTHLVELVVSALEDKKGIGIVYIDFSKVSNTVAQYFVICHGTSNVHVATLADGVIEKVGREMDEKPWNREGMENAEWILLDYADVVVHLFQENTRNFYNLESLWADMEVHRVDNSA